MELGGQVSLTRIVENYPGTAAAETAAAVLGKELGGGQVESLDPIERLEGAMRRSVLQAHEAIREKTRTTPSLEGMGTTITALALDPDTDTFVLGHVGDSRAYRLRGGALTQLTRDDTWVQDRVEAEQLTVEQARRHPFAHLLTQCLGLEDTPVPHISHGPVRVGDAYLLCTDGLAGMLEDPRLLEILTDELGTNGAQAEGATGQPFARHWMHGEFLFIRGSKMSKRFGNTLTARDLREEGVRARVDADLALGTDLGVDGTPSVFLNGRRVRDLRPAVLSLLIAAEIEETAK